MKARLIGLLGLFALSAGAAEHKVSSAADIARVADTAKPGDVVVMADGTWENQVVVFKGKGTAEKPITLKAATPGKVVLTGKSSLTIDGDYLVVSGVFLKDGQLTGDGVKLAGHACRLTECAVVDGTYKFFVHFFGTENRMDHCYLAEKTTESPTLQVEVQGQPNHHQIDHNHFGHRPALGRNGGETMRIGYSHQSMTNSQTTVEFNLFERCDGELEIISNKSCENTYRFNTFLDCAGMVTLRHGNRCVVESNFIIGHHKRGSGGIRVIGEGHRIINNYIDGVYQGGFWVTSGIPDSPLNAYFQARDCVIAFNTVVDSRGPCIEQDAGIGTSKRTLRPANITIANNVFTVPSGGTLLKGKEGEGFKWMGNVATAAAPLAEHQGIRVIDPKLERGKDGLLRPTSGSPVRGAAEGDFASVKADIDGQPRSGKLDAGCDQVSNAPVTNHPLTPTEVGPSWMERTVNGR